MREDTLDRVEFRTVRDIEDRLNIQSLVDLLDLLHFMDRKVIHEDSKRNSHIHLSLPIEELDKVSVLPSSGKNLNTF